VTKHNKARPIETLLSGLVTNEEPCYSSSEYEDELVWAAAWLYKATEEQAYLTKAEEIYAGNMLLFYLFFCVFVHDADMIIIIIIIITFIYPPNNDVIKSIHIAR
jgi:hypothetical protein